MPRIKLAFWHGDKQPGDKLDVTDDELRDLKRDGRVAEVLDAAQDQPEPQPKPQPSARPDVEEAAPPDGAASGRKQR